MNPRSSGGRAVNEGGTSDRLREGHDETTEPRCRADGLRGVPRGADEVLKIGSEGDVDDLIVTHDDGTVKPLQPQPRQQQRARQEPAICLPPGEGFVTDRGLREGRVLERDDGHDRVRDDGALGTTGTGRMLLGSDVAAAASPACVNPEWSERERLCGGHAANDRRTHLSEGTQSKRQLPGSDVRHPAARGLCVQTRSSGEVAATMSDVPGSLGESRDDAAGLRLHANILLGEARGAAVELERGGGGGADGLPSTHSHEDLALQQPLGQHFRRQRRAYDVDHLPGEISKNERMLAFGHGGAHYRLPGIGECGDAAAHGDEVEGRHHRATADSADLHMQSERQPTVDGVNGAAACSLSIASASFAEADSAIGTDGHSTEIAFVPELSSRVGEDERGVAAHERAETQPRDCDGGEGLGVGRSVSTSAGYGLVRRASVSGDSGASRGGARPQHQAAG